MEVFYVIQTWFVTFVICYVKKLTTKNYIEDFHSVNFNPFSINFTKKLHYWEIYVQDSRESKKTLVYTCKWEGNFLSTFCEINGNINKTYWDTPHCITHQTLGQQPAWIAAWTWEKNSIISKSPELKQILSWKKFSLKPQWSIDNLLLEIYLLLWTQFLSRKYLF